MMSGGNMDLSNMKSMMGENPAMQNMIKDPAFIKSAMGMFRDPQNKAMIDMMT
jgi:hypothetical protein